MLLEPRGVLIKKLEFTPDVLHHVELPERSDLMYRKSQIILPFQTSLCPLLQKIKVL